MAGAGSCGGFLFLRACLLVVGRFLGRPERKGQRRALEAAPVTSGAIDGHKFEWIADADSRLGPIIEVIINGRYTWVPFNNVSKIEVEKPVDLRDLVWLPANFTWTNGGQLVALIPTRR